MLANSLGTAAHNGSPGYFADADSLFTLVLSQTTCSVLLELTLSIKGPEAVLDRVQVILLSGRHFC